MASKQKPFQYRNSTSIDENSEQDPEKRKLKEEIFSLRKKLESMALDKAALIQASSRYRAERNEFEYKIRKEKVKIFTALRKEQTIIMDEHQKEVTSMMESLSVQNAELVSLRAQLRETMEMLTDFMINPVTNLTPNQNDSNMLTTTVNLASPAAGPSREPPYESPLKTCSSIANCARIIAERQPRRGWKYQGFGKIRRSPQPRNFKCDKCPLRFFRFAHLKRHTRVDHCEPQGLQEEVTGCRLCGLLFKKREDHGMHVIMVHINNCNVNTRTLIGFGNTEERIMQVDDDDIEVDIEN